MAEFIYINAKNANTNYTLFELNYGYHSQVFFKDNIDSSFKSHSANELVKELKELMNICQQNLFNI